MYLRTYIHTPSIGRTVCRYVCMYVCMFIPTYISQLDAAAKDRLLESFKKKDSL